MSKEFFKGELGSNQKEVSIRAINEAQKGLAGFFGIKRASIRFTHDDVHGPWNLKIDGSNDLGIRMHSTGALEVLKVEEGESEWKRISSPQELVDIYYQKNKDKESFVFKFNKKKFEPNEFVLKQTEFIGEEKAPKKGFWKKVKEWGRNLVREATYDENMLGFLAGGASVALLGALAGGNIEAAAPLKEILSNSLKYATSASAVLTSAHPILYLLETRTGVKFFKDLRRVTNFFAMMGWGATGAIIASNTIEIQDEANMGTKHATPNFSNENLDNNEVVIEEQPQIDEGQNTNPPEDSPNIDAYGINVSTEINTDYDLWQKVGDGWMEVVSENNWTSEDADLRWFLTDQTFEFLKVNGVEDLHEVDFSNLQSYLKPNQINFLESVSQTKSHSDLLNLISKTPDLTK